MKPIQSQRFYLIDSMRSVMLLIVLAHAHEGHHIDALFEALPTPIQFIIQNGQWGVGLFFVISGFVITHNLADREIDISLSWRFLLRRSVRLDPPYWVAMGLTVAMAWVSYFVVANKVAPSFSFGQILAHFFYAQELLGYQHLDPAYWTLCYEFQFYIVFVIALLIGGGSPLRDSGENTKIILVSISLFTALWPLNLGPFLFRGLFLSDAYMFFLGVNAYWAYRSKGIRPWFVAYAIVLIVGGFVNRDAYASFCATSSLFLLYMACNKKMGASERWWLLQFLGKVSYSVYLTHNAVTGAVFRIGYMITGRSVATELLWLLVDVFVCVMAGYLMWFAVERPSTEISRGIKLQNSKKAMSIP